MKYFSKDVMYLPVLSGGSRDNFGGGIIKMTVVIVVEHAGIKQFLLSNGNQDFVSETVAERVQESKLTCKVCRSICGLPKFWT